MSVEIAVTCLGYQTLGNVILFISFVKTVDVFQSIPKETPVFFKEYKTGIYGASPYFISKMVSNVRSFHISLIRAFVHGKHAIHRKMAAHAENVIPVY